MANYLGCDVDLTICSSDRGWLEWLYSKASDKDQEEYSLFCGLPKQPYNLSEMFPSVQNPMEYWNNLDYDQFEPLEGSVEALERISKCFGIVFISHIEGGSHGKLKQKWLKKHYPFLTGTIFTREKFLMNDSVVAHIDDRVSHLQGFDYHKRILFDTPYTQDVECDVYKTLNSWKDVDEKFIDKVLGTRWMYD